MLYSINPITSAISLFYIAQLSIGILRIIYILSPKLISMAKQMNIKKNALRIIYFYGVIGYKSPYIYKLGYKPYK